MHKFCGHLNSLTLGRCPSTVRLVTGPAFSDFHVGLSTKFGGSHQSSFQKCRFGGCSPVPKAENWTTVPKAGTRVQKTEQQYQKPEQGHIRQNHLFTQPSFCFLSRSNRTPYSDNPISCTQIPLGMTPNRARTKIFHKKCFEALAFSIRFLTGNPPKYARSHVGTVPDTVLGHSLTLVGDDKS